MGDLSTSASSLSPSEDMRSELPSMSQLSSDPVEEVIRKAASFQGMVEKAPSSFHMAAANAKPDSKIASETEGFGSSYVSSHKIELDEAELSMKNKRSIISKSRCLGMFLWIPTVRAIASLPSNISFRSRLAIYLSTSKVGVFLDLFQTFISVLACLLYVVDTYETSGQAEWISILELVLNVLFTLDYLLRFYLAEDRLWYPFTPYAMIDALTIIPVYLQLVLGQNNQLSFLRFIRVFRALRVLKAYRTLSLSVSPLYREIFLITFLVLIIVVVFAGLYHLFENVLGDEEDLMFHDSLYFIVVSISTVGYGDIRPTTTYGKITVVVMICLSIGLVPLQTTKMLAILDMQGAFNGSVKLERNKRHIVITGIVAASSLRDFLVEFYHEGIGKHIAVVVLQPRPPGPDMVDLLMNPVYEDVLTYLYGSPTSDRDLYRAGVDIADACFIMTDKNSKRPDVEDSATILRIMTARNFSRDLRIYCQYISPTNKKYVEAAGATVAMSLEEFKMNLLAKSCLCPGFTTLLVNLLRHHTVDSALSQSNATIHPWQREYFWGSSYSIYLDLTPPVYIGKRFGVLADQIFHYNNTILFSVETMSAEGEPTAVMLFPGYNYVLKSTDRLGFLAQSQEKVNDLLGKRFADSLVDSEEYPENAATWQSADDFPFLPLQECRKESYTALSDAYVYELPKSISNHVLVCGGVQGLVSFLLHMRRSQWGTQRPIVILHEKEPAQDIWDHISDMGNIYYVKGSPLASTDLLRGGVDRIHRIVVFSDSHLVSVKDTLDPRQIDSEAILSVLNVETHVKDRQDAYFLAELTQSSNLDALNAKLLRDVSASEELTSAESSKSCAKRYLTTMGQKLMPFRKRSVRRSQLQTQSKAYGQKPYFASGRVFCSSMLFDSLLSQSFGKEGLLRIAKRLVYGPTPGWPHCSVLEWFSVSPEHIGREFGEVFSFYLKNDILAVGLFRARCSLDSLLPYVFTAPPSQTPLMEYDYIYALVLKPTAKNDSS